MIEGRNQQSSPLAAVRSRVEEHHRVEPARDREHNPLVRRERRRNDMANRIRGPGKHMFKIAHAKPLPRVVGWMRRHRSRYTSTACPRVRSVLLETHGPFGTLWVGLGLGCFYIALIWLNTLLGFFLTPLFVIPGTWLQDRLASARKRQ